MFLQGSSPERRAQEIPTYCLKEHDTDSYRDIFDDTEFKLNKLDRVGLCAMCGMSALRSLSLEPVLQAKTI